MVKKRVKVKNLKEKKCLKVGCCAWDSGMCWSAVGTDTCKSTSQKYGGCHIEKECTKCIKTPLKFISDIKSLPSAGPSMMSMMVNGLHLVGLESTESYIRWCWVVTAITEILNNTVSDLEMQKEVISNLYKRKVVGKLIAGKEIEFTDSFEDSNSVCDIIGIKADTETESGQISEILEHILHFIHIGERYTFSQWSTESEMSTDAWAAVLQAEEAGVYDTSGYNDIKEDEVRRRVILQEFHFWLVLADWDILNDGEFNLGFGEWKGVDNLTDMEKKIPKAHKLYTKTTGTVLGKPTIETLRSLGSLRKSSKPESCKMPKL